MTSNSVQRLAVTKRCNIKTYSLYVRVLLKWMKQYEKAKDKVNVLHNFGRFGCFEDFSITTIPWEALGQNEEARQKSSPFHKQKSFRDINHRFDSPFIGRYGHSVSNTHVHGLLNLWRRLCWRLKLRIKTNRA